METPNENPAPPPADPVNQLSLESIPKLVKENSVIPTILTRAFAAAGIGLRARVLSRLLPSVGPLALTVLGGGVFAKYVQHARWSALSVSVSDAARVTSTQIFELATYVQQSNPEVARQILSVLARDTSTMTALGATLGAIMISYLSGKTSWPGE